MGNIEDTVASIWDRNAADWIPQVRDGRDLYREVFNNPSFLEFLPDLSERHVIDLGCGEGRNTRLFAMRGARVTGIDLSPRLIEAARAAETAEPLGIDYHLGSFADLKRFPNDTFDAAVSTMAFMDGPGFPDVAHAIHRVLRPVAHFISALFIPVFVRAARAG
jgi:SAM-dependent methyltransferase